MSKINFAGLVRDTDIEAANLLLPDYCSFTFIKGRRHAIPKEVAESFRAQLNPAIRVIGVFAGNPPMEIVKMAESGLFDAIQLDGNEPEEEVRFLRDVTHLPILKTYAVSREDDIRRAGVTCADYVVLDNEHGGSDEPFNWGFLEAFPRPFFLAGGIDETNLETALSLLGPYCVNISGGIETDGFKDPEKMKRLLSIVRGFEE